MSRQSGRTSRVEPTGVQVTRRRRRVSRARLGLFGGTGRWRGIVAIGATAVILAGAGATYASTVGFGDNHPTDTT
jgi:anti-sigma-K factor RskA